MNDIVKAQERANVKYDLAKKIRAMLDDARKAYGPQQWDDDSVESDIFDMLTEEG